jgi:DNA polymerase III alpha subunit
MWTEDNTQQQLVNGVIKYGPDILDHCKTSDDISKYLDRITQEHLNYPLPKKDIDCSKWFIPYDYETIDIESFLVDRCPKENYDRLIKELELFRQHNMLPLLRTMKYIVDTLKANNIVWGVGRGSSVASYVLFLLGVHRIDSVKYSLPIEEFFKGEQNG